MSFLKRYPVLVSIPVLFLVWALAFHLGWVGRTLLAGPGEVFDRFVTASRPDIPREAAIFQHARHTILLGLSGWGLALGLGSVVGLTLGTKPAAYLACEPLIEFIRAVPPVLAFP